MIVDDGELSVGLAELHVLLPKELVDAFDAKCEQSKQNGVLVSLIENWLDEQRRLNIASSPNPK